MNRQYKVCFSQLWYQYDFGSINKAENQVTYFGYFVPVFGQNG